jgi:chemotaxis protein CheD
MDAQEAKIKKIEELHVKIGEVKLGRSGNILKATLGSCVGISFYWPEKKLYGLAHCLLPRAPVATTQIGAKYVSQAIPSLMAMMKISEEDIPKIEVRVAGGANMMVQLARSNPHHIGIQNSETAKELLEKLGFKIKVMEVGGDQGRQICVDCDTSEITIKKFVKSA